MIFSSIVTAVGSVASTFMEGQVAKSKAKANVMVAEAEAKAEIMRTAATHAAKRQSRQLEGRGMDPDLYRHHHRVFYSGSCPAYRTWFSGA